MTRPYGSSLFLTHRKNNLVMNKAITIIGMILAAVPAHGGDVLFKADFNSGMPEGIELISNDNLSVNLSDYNRLSPESTWFTGSIYGADGHAAVSVSRRIPADSRTDNWMILPKIHVSSDKNHLQWSARSVHHDLPDGYSVMISEGDYTKFKPVFTMKEESYSWTRHVLPLEEYYGKDIYIAFCHNSTNRFAIAVDDISVGDIVEYSVRARNKSRHFIGETDKAELNFNIVNTGRQIDLKNIILEIEGGKTYTYPHNDSMATGAETDVSCCLPVETGNSYTYTVWLETEDGTKINALNDILTCSYYPRIMLLEKFTGTWCNNCPSAIPFVNRVKDRLGDEVAIIEVHGYNKNLDPMSCDQYAISVGVRSFPTVMLNRGTAQTGYFDNDGYLTSAMTDVTNGMIEAGARWTEDGRISINTKTQFAENLDNSLNRYRIGVLIKEKHIDNGTLGYKQANNCTSLKDQEYSYMPGTLSGDLISFHDIARCGDTDENVKTLGITNGIKESLPSVIQAGSEYEKNIIIDMPENVIDKKELSVIVILFNNTEVINAAVVDEISSSSGFNNTQAEKHGISITACGDGYKAALPDHAPYKMTVYAPDGTCVHTESGNGDTCEISKQKTLKPGCYFVRITQGSISASGKILIR